MTIVNIERRLAKIEAARRPPRGLHRYSDEEIECLIAWLRDPHPADEEWAVDLFRREGLIR